jgi:hypothetical protein
VRWLFLVALLGCGKKDSGPTCEVVIEHMLAVTKEAMAGHDNVKIDGQKTAMIEQCKKREMPLETRTCIMAAKTLREISICRNGKPSSIDRKPRDRGLGSGSVRSGSGSATPPTGTTPPTSTGSGSGSGSAK